MNFNLELYRKYRRVAGVKAKDGIFDITVFPNGLYCFATKQKLGINGLITDHPYQGKIIQTGDKKYEFDSICIHWNEGFYYHASIRRLGTKSHGTVIFANINSKASYVDEAVEEFNRDFKFINE